MAASAAMKINRGQGYDVLTLQKAASAFPFSDRRVYRFVCAIRVNNLHPRHANVREAVSGIFPETSLEQSTHRFWRSRGSAVQSGRRASPTPALLASSPSKRGDR